MTEPRRFTARTIGRELAALAVVVLIALSGKSSLASNYRIPTGSMRPTVEIDDRVLVNRAAYGVRVPFTSHYAVDFDGPALGDVVVLDSPVEDKVLLKRVVGLPGQRVEVQGGQLTIDNKPAAIEQRADGLYEHLGIMVHQVYLTNGGGPDWGPTLIPDGRYLVMGDNRGDSADGRSFGLVDRDAILGRAFGVYWRDGSPTWEDL